MGFADTLIKPLCSSSAWAGPTDYELRRQVSAGFDRSNKTRVQSPIFLPNDGDALLLSICAFNAAASSIAPALALKSSACCAFALRSVLRLPRPRRLPRASEERLALIELRLELVVDVFPRRLFSSSSRGGSL